MTRDVSPLYADLRGLPPMLIQVGTAEMLQDDGRRFAGVLANVAGVDVTLEEYAGMVHVWHFTYLVEPWCQAVHSIGQFVADKSRHQSDAAPHTEPADPLFGAITGI